MVASFRANYQLARFASESRLGCRKTSHGHPEGRTRHVAQSNFFTKNNGFRVAPMLSAETDFEVRTHLPAPLGSNLHKLAHRLIQRRERVVVDDPLLGILAQEAASVVAAQAKRRLRQVIGAE